MKLADLVWGFWWLAIWAVGAKTVRGVSPDTATAIFTIGYVAGGLTCFVYGAVLGARFQQEARQSRMMAKPPPASGATVAWKREPPPLRTVRSGSWLAVAALVCLGVGLVAAGAVILSGVSR
jgi:hypothetical protein